MIEMQLGQVYARIEKAFNESDQELAQRLLWGALDQFPDDPQLLFYAGVALMKEDKLALAKVVLERCVALFPNGRNYANLGACYRRMNRIDGARECLQRSVDYEPTNPAALNSIAASYVNEGNPQPGIEAALRALEVDPKFMKARWNLGMLYLEAGEFAKGWDCYRDGLVSGERLMRNYKTATADPVYLEDLWPLMDFVEEHGRKPRVIVWGEQGMGDELMLGTMLPDLAEYAEIVYDCHVRLEQLLKDSYPFVAEFHPTREDAHITWPHEVAPCDFKLSIADLGRLFRRSRDAFPRRPTLRADPALVDEYRTGLEAIAPGKRFIGIAWSGGVVRTMRRYRSIDPRALWPILQADDVMPVSLQYEDDALACEQFYRATGKHLLRFPGITTHHDYHHTAALVMALDEVITVCTSVAHLSAALGQKTSVLVPTKPAWRYGLTGAQWYWYGDNARLYRQDIADEWTGPLARLFVEHGASPLPAHERDILGPVRAGQTMLELGCKQLDGYKRYFEALGLEHTSIDLNGLGGSLKLDLTEQLDLGQQYDIVTNFGTSEHVPEQQPCWDNMHRALKVGGTLVCTTPFPGDWAEHGRWYPDEQWYREWCHANGYLVGELKVSCAAPRRMVCLWATKTRDVPMRWPDYPMYLNETGKKVGAYA